MTAIGTGSGGDEAATTVVHVVAKTHLDLGFTGLAAEVEHRYLTAFFPKALDVATALRERGGPERLVWTTGSWIAQRTLCTGGRSADAVAAGIERGDLAWHGLPVTTHTELMDASLVRSGLAISTELDHRFGRTTAETRTVAAKMTDVPGHTRSLVPLLAEAGVRFLHIGVNPAWPVPDVPPVFRWRSPDGSEVVVAYQAGGYGGTVGVPGCGEALAFLHAGDNLGPPTVQQVIDAHADLAAAHPGAEIRASTLDAFARALVASGAVEHLPVVTAEIGDPWLFGAGSDPAKVAAYRHLLRARRSSPRRDIIDRTLLLVAEHTWGLDQKEALPDTTHWDRAGLAELRSTPEARRFERSWAEQRSYVVRGARLLEPGLPADVDVEALAGWTSAALPGRGTDSVATGDAIPQGGTVREGETVSVGGWAFTVDEAGAVVGLVDEETGRVVADPAHPLGLVSYQSFDAADYERFYDGLTPSPEDQWWARWDNTKPGIDAVPVARSGRWTPTLTDIVKTTVDPDPVDPDLLGLAADGHPGGAGLWVRVTFDPELTSELGVPPEAWIHWSVGSGDGPTSPRRLSDGSGPHRDQGDWAETSASGAPSGVGGTVRPSARVLSASLAWPTKPANRLPEALWWSFNPVVAEPDRWRMDKLGQPVSPLDVVRRGGRSLHGVGDGGLTYDGPEGSLRIQTLDAPLVAPGSPNLLDADPPLPDLDRGWHVLLADNCWGTNFPMWIEGAARYRVRITWRASSRRG